MRLLIDFLSELSCTKCGPAYYIVCTSNKVISPVGMPNSLPPLCFPCTTGARRNRGKNGNTEELTCRHCLVSTITGPEIFDLYSTQALWSKVVYLDMSLHYKC